MQKPIYKQFEIWWVELNPVVGNETAKNRPCVVLQNDVGNAFASTTIIAPLLKTHKDYPFVVNIRPSLANQLDTDRHINLSQLRTVSYLRFGKKQGVIEAEYHEAIQQALSIEFKIV